MESSIELCRLGLAESPYTAISPRLTARITRPGITYYCKNTCGETGHRCSFRTNLEQTELDRYVAAIISALVHDRQFEAAIQKKIGTAVNTDDLEKELDTVKGQLRQMLSIKSRLENQMDTLDVSDPQYERKILDLQRRYDDQYDKIAEAELQIEDIRKRIQTIRSEQISGENVYQLLLAFDELYGEMDEPGKKELLRAIIERIDLFPEKREDGCWIRNIVFAFPVPIQGHEVKELLLEKTTLIERYMAVLDVQFSVLRRIYTESDVSLLDSKLLAAILEWLIEVGFTMEEDVLNES